jgi:hypothetical protein
MNGKQSFRLVNVKPCKFKFKFKIMTKVPERGS